MAICRNCGNKVNFNVWCIVKRVLEVELDENNNLVAVVGEPEDERFQTEEISIAENDVEFSIVNCAWCGSEDIDFQVENDQIKEQ